MITKNVQNVLNRVANMLQVNPNYLYRLIKFESNFKPNAKNPYSSARGLIQFIDSTAKGMGYASSADLVAQHPTIEEQLQGPVFAYLNQYAPFPTEQSLYMSVFYPKARNWALSQPFPEYVRKVNPGIKTVGDYVNKVRRKGGNIIIQAATPILTLAIGSFVLYLYFKSKRKEGFDGRKTSTKAETDEVDIN